MIYIIPIPKIANTSGSIIQRTILDGVEFVIRFDYNQRGETWTMSVSDQDDEAIAMGLVLKPGRPMLSLLTGKRRPRGEIVLIDTTGENDYPTLENLGERFILTYIPKS